MQKMPARFYLSLFTSALLLLFQLSTANAVTFVEQGSTLLIQPPGSVLQDVRSISFADIDNDGDPDMLMQGTPTGRRMFLNNHFGAGTNNFTMITTGPVNSNDGTGFSSAWGDYNGDGLVDCFLGENNSGSGAGATGDLYRNDGGSFTNVTASTVPDPGFAQSVAFADLNHDGRLDVLIAMEGPEMHEAYMQNPNGTFTQAGATLGLHVPNGTKAYGLAIGDTDGDGDMDLYISTCIDTFSIRKNFFENITSSTAFGFAFQDIADSNGTQNLNNGYAAGFFDFDNDGDLDLFVVGSDGRPSKIYINNGNNQFTDLDTIKGHALISMTGGDFNGGEVIDYDNDGYLDLYFHDHLTSSAFSIARRLYHNNGDMTFTDVTESVGLGGVNEGGYDSAWADVDLDGDLDLACATNSVFPERLFISDASTNGNHWLYVRPRGQGQNTRAIGAQLYATIHKNTPQERTLRRDANTNALAFHQSDLPVHFGLGDATVVDDLRIKWPDGSQTVLHDVSPDQYLTVGESPVDPCLVTTGTLGDCNNNGILDSCEITSAPEIDCDNNGIIDNCELAGHDCNSNEVLDACEITSTPSLDCDNNGVLDECELAGRDCNSNGTIDACDIASSPSLDCNNNGMIDECEIALTPPLDCNLNGVIDACELPCTPICHDDFTTGTFDQSQWLPLGSQDDVFGNTVYDASAGAFLATVFDNGNQYRVTGIFENSSDCIPYSAVGTANYVKGKFYIYHGGQSPNSSNNIPMLRARIATRFAVTSMLELQSHVDVDPQATAVGQDIVPSCDPTKPSLYRVDFDPVDVPALSNPGDQGKLLRGFEAFAVSVQDNGYLALTEISVCIYPASSLPQSQPPDLVLTTGTLDAGSLAVRNAATDLMLGTFDTTGAADLSIPRPTYTEGPEGITLDSTLVPSNYMGIAAREFNPGPETTFSQRLRVESCKIYKVRFHVTSTQQSNLNSQVRWRARSVRFNWTEKFQIGGAFPAGDLTNQIAQQALPGIGCQNPDKDGNENGGWYTLLMNTPLSPDIRPEFPPGTPLSVSMPHLSAEPGPGVSAPSLRDLRVAADIVDTNDHDFRAPLEAGNMTVDRIEIRSYPLEND